MRDSGSGEFVLRLGVGFRRLGGLPRGSGLLLRAGLQGPLCLANPFQATLASLQFRRQFIAAPIRPVLGILGRIRGLGLCQQLRHLVTQLPLFVPHPAVTHRLVLRRVRFDLAPVERHPTVPWPPQLARQPEHLLEEALQGRQVPLAKIGDGAKVRGVAGASTRNGTCSTNRRWIFRDEETPTQ